MCIKISKFIIFIKWVLLYINAWGIYMGSEKIHSLFQWLCSHMEHCDGLVHAYCVYLISCLYFFTVSDDLFQVLIPFFFNSFNRKTYTFPLCLSGIQAGLIILIYCLKTAQFLCTVLTPCIFSLHWNLLLIFFWSVSIWSVWYCSLHRYSQNLLTSKRVFF